MSESRIKWCLADLMRDKGRRNKDLVSMTGLHAVTISKLKHTEMPERLERSTLEKLCDALECEPGDLMWLNKCPQKSTKSITSTEELSQKKNLSQRQVKMNEQSTQHPEANSIINLTFPAPLKSELLERATTIDYCAGSLIEEVEALPQETRDQVSPLLAVLRRACREQLAMLNPSEHNSSEAEIGVLGEALPTN